MSVILAKADAKGSFVSPNKNSKVDSVKKQQLLKHLETLANQELPESFYRYKEAEIKHIVRFADDVVAFQTAGLDKLFESMSLAMKYIPNFVLVSLTKRFLEAPLAARITQKITVSQAVTVGDGLPADYLAEVTIYQEPHLSATILAKLCRPHALDILSILCQRNPLKVLDMYSLLTSELQHFVKDTINIRSIDEEDLLSTSRKQAYFAISGDG